MFDNLERFDRIPFSIFKAFNLKAYTSLERIVFESLRNSAKDLFGIRIEDLENLHKKISLENINEFRVEGYKRINKSDILNLIYDLQSPLLNQLLGPDLAAQKLVNLSIVPPHDLSSTIPFHSDINTGESLYELVSWIPFTNCSGSNSIFLCDPYESLELHKNLGKLNAIDSQSISQYAENNMKLNYMDLKKSDCLLFSPILYHGSSINESETTRVSINLRFKSLFSAYNHHDCEGKGLNDFFQVFKKSKLTSFVESYTAPNFA